jgi:uncharacterized protein (DUF2267 family)
VDEATTVIRAVLQTLADHMAGNAPAKFAAQLPAEIGEFVTEYKSDETAEGERFGVEEFFSRVANRAGVEEDEAEPLTLAVFAALREAVSSGEMNKVRGTLPPEYGEFFEG